MAQTITQDGKEYEVLGYKLPRPGDTFVSESGKVTLSVISFRKDQRLIVKLVMAEYTFGGVVFEVIGKKRPALQGEWYLSLDEESLGLVKVRQTLGNYKILRPVRLA